MGENIDAWIQLLTAVHIPQLQRLNIQRTESDAGHLSHASVMFVLRLIKGCPLVGLKFKNIRLQETKDWVAIVDSADPYVLREIDMCETTWGELATVQAAVDLYTSKFGTREDTTFEFR